MPHAVLPRQHGHRIRCLICYILFFRRLESKLVFILLLYQFIDSIESLRLTPLPTPRPRRVCAGSGVTVKSAPLEAAEAHHGGVVCGLCCVDETRKNVLFLRRKSTEGKFFVPAGMQIALKLLTNG